MYAVDLSDVWRGIIHDEGFMGMEHNSFCLKSMNHVGEIESAPRSSLNLNQVQAATL